MESMPYLGLGRAFKAPKASRRIVYEVEGLCWLCRCYVGREVDISNTHAMSGSWSSVHR